MKSTFNNDKTSNQLSNTGLINQMLRQLKPKLSVNIIHSKTINNQKQQNKNNGNAFKNKKIEILKQKLSMQQSQLNHWKSKQQQLIQNNLNLKIKLKRKILKNERQTKSDSLSIQNMEFNSQLYIQEKTSIVQNQSQERKQRKNITIVIEQEQDDFNLQDVNFMKLKKQRYSNQQYSRNKSTNKLKCKQNIDPNLQGSSNMIHSLVQWPKDISKLGHKNRSNKIKESFNNNSQLQRKKLAFSYNAENNRHKTMRNNNESRNRQQGKCSLNSTVSFQKEKNSKISKREKSPIKVIKKIYCSECDQNLAPNQFFSHKHLQVKDKVNKSRAFIPDDKLQVSDLI